MRALVILAAGFISSSLAPAYASADIVKLICQNPRREYVVEYNNRLRTLTLDGETNYKILAVEKTPERYVIAGLTVEGGPTFQLHLRPYRKMDFYSGESLQQTDGCR